MSPKQIKVRQCLMALYTEVPPEVAASVTTCVMDALEELEIILEKAHGREPKTDCDHEYVKVGTGFLQCVKCGKTNT